MKGTQGDVTEDAFNEYLVTLIEQNTTDEVCRWHRHDLAEISASQGFLLHRGSHAGLWTGTGKPQCCCFLRPHLPRVPQRVSGEAGLTHHTGDRAPGGWQLTPGAQRRL